jgi:hypothetical protein
MPRASPMPPPPPEAGAPTAAAPLALLDMLAALPLFRFGVLQNELDATVSRLARGHAHGLAAIKREALEDCCAAAARAAQQRQHARLASEAQTLLRHRRCCGTSGSTPLWSRGSRIGSAAASTRRRGMTPRGSPAAATRAS